MKLLLCALFAILVALATGNVVINGVCRDCSPPEAETLVVGDKVYRGRPGQGTVYINGGQDYSTGQRGQGGLGGLGGGAAGAGGPSVVPEGYSGPVGDSYVHNTDCNGCDIRG